MNTNTPLSTPTKCGCAGGIVVSCGMEESVHGKPRSKHAKKPARSMTCTECTQCSPKKTLNVRCGEGEMERNRIGTKGIRLVESAREPNGDKRWYATVLRGAFGRWSTRGRNKNSTRVQLKASLSYDSARKSNVSTNNNCDASERCGNAVSPCRGESKTLPNTRTVGLEKGAKSDPDLTGRRLKVEPFLVAKDSGGHSSNFRNHHLSTDLGDECSGHITPAGASAAQVRGARASDRADRRPKSDSGPIIKLPSLPYGDNEIQSKGSAGAKTKEKWQRTKRRFLSSPIHRKENQNRQKGHSTYVSFQDEFAEDVYLNIEAQKEITSASASPATVRSGSLSDSPLQVSPSSLADDVFSETYVSDCKTRPKLVHGTVSDLAASREELDDERIAKLFEKVNNAFEKSEMKQKGIVCQIEERTLCTSESESTPSEPSATPGLLTTNFPPSTKAPLEFQMEHIDTIMASANLHASLDNALSMLSESTKLLIPDESQPWSTGSYNSRHQPGGGMFRSRTYSTCSKLEPIAEENDKTEVDGTYDEDAVGCTVSDSSAHAKSKFENMRSAACVEQEIPSTRFSGTTKASFNVLKREDNSNFHTKESNPKLQWLLKTPCSKVRSKSTSTISVGSLQRSRGGETARGPSTTDKCIACEWVRQVRLPPSVSVIPYGAWPQIVKDCGSCHNHTHFHPWGMCGEQESVPVLCHSHYLQYYQHLQNNQANRGQGRVMHPASSLHPESIIDYDIHDVVSNLDDLMLTSPEICPSRIQANATSCNGMRQHFVDTQLRKGPYKQSDTDVSMNSDSAFSTNGSPTSSTRDGMNTDGESIGSMSEKLESEEELGKMRGFYNDSWLCNGEFMDACIPSQREQRSRHFSLARGKRTQSYDDAKSGNQELKCSKSHPENRYSVVSSVCSYSAPLTADHLCDSAVHLQDSASSHSTQLSSDSFYSSGTSFGDKEACLTDGMSDSAVLSRSSSEASLQSEGTLCLSEFAMSQQNISLFSAPSFPQITDLCSPIRQGIPTETHPKHQIADQFDDWVKKTKTNESVLESFLNSSLAHMQERMNASPSERSSTTTSTIQNTDTLTSSSGSSDTNTLGSGSSGSSYASSSLRSYSRFNTLDSSSCVSTDDTGETVIDQYMLRPSGGKLHNIQETESTPRHQRGRRKRSSEARVRYQPSAFHYENLEAPSFPSKFNTLRHQYSQTTNICFKKDDIDLAVSKGVTKTAHIMTSRARSSSMSCVMTSVTKTSCIVKQSKSLPSIYLSRFMDQRSIKIVNPKESTSDLKEIQPKSIPPEHGPILQLRVNSMMRNCTDIDNVIASLRESLKSTSSKETESYLDEKLLELSRIMKQKDEMIHQLQQMLLDCSVPARHISHNHQLNATM